MAQERNIGSLRNWAQSFKKKAALADLIDMFINKDVAKLIQFHKSLTDRKIPVDVMASVVTGVKNPSKDKTALYYVCHQFASSNGAIKGIYKGIALELMSQLAESGFFTGRAIVVGPDRENTWLYALVSGDVDIFTQINELLINRKIPVDVMASVVTGVEDPSKGKTALYDAFNLYSIALALIHQGAINNLASDLPFGIILQKAMELAVKVNTRLLVHILQSKIKQLSTTANVSEEKSIDVDYSELFNIAEKFSDVDCDVYFFLGQAFEKEGFINEACRCYKMVHESSQQYNDACFQLKKASSEPRKQTIASAVPTSEESADPKRHTLARASLFPQSTLTAKQDSVIDDKDSCEDRDSDSHTRTCVIS